MMRKRSNGPLSFLAAAIIAAIIGSMLIVAVALIEQLTREAQGASYDIETNPPRVPARVLRVIDGDTLDVVAYPWPGTSIRARVRLSDIDAPETYRPLCDRERAKGIEATQRAEQLIAAADGEVTIYVYEPDNFGRMLGTVFVSGRSIGAVLLNEDLALPWGERDRREEMWCNAL